MNFPMTPEYVAGFFDGEGCVSLTKRQNKGYGSPHVQLQVMIANSHEGIIDLFMKQFGGFKSEKPTGFGSTSFCLKFSSEEAEAFLRYIQYDVIIKAREVEVALALIERRRLPGWRVRRLKDAKGKWRASQVKTPHALAFETEVLRIAKEEKDNRSGRRAHLVS